MPTKKTDLSVERLRAVLSYDRTTGLFTWLVAVSRKIRVGSVAGSVNPDGYVRLKIDGIDYLAHRLAWFFETARWPECEIDHEDRNRANNRWRNLREATGTQNQMNRGRQRNNTTGFKGVTSYAHKGLAKPFMARIGGQYLGHFATAAEANAAYEAAAVAAHGEFARAA
jgi:hypothetical protein